MESEKIYALKVKQWLKEWDKVKFGDSSGEIRSKPNQYFLLFSLKAGILKKLSKVYPRRADEKREIEIGIQRKHDVERSEEIRKYLNFGYPLCEYIKKDNDIPSDKKDLRMPGWIPTVIVANILKKGTKRGELTIKDEDLIEIVDKESQPYLILPKNLNNKKWNPKIPPIEIIDGQHRLWAFELNDKISDEFELPVVAFFDLDITWEAYLFYTINVTPKKINRSLAYDLIPLLRTQEWLERAPDQANVYRETRAQEIVEVLWSYEYSPWRNRINMLGETKKFFEEKQYLPNVTQASFIRNLMATFIKTKITNGLGGLFGAKLTDTFNQPLGWNRIQQASFIIYIWQLIYDNIEICDFEWAKSLRKRNKNFQDKGDLAFLSQYSLISSDQGVRGIMHIFNDFCYFSSKELKLREINWSDDKINIQKIDHNLITSSLKDIRKTKSVAILNTISLELMKFDWRTSSEPNLNNEQRKSQMIFKSASGYRELRRQLLELLAQSKDITISKVSKEILKQLNYAS